MRTRWPWASLLLLAAASAWADEPVYTIKFKPYPDEGKSLVCRENSKREGLIRVRDVDGKIIKEDKPLEESEELYTLTVLESGDQVPRRYRQTFEKATSTTLEDKVRSYQGLAIEYNLRGGKYHLELPDKHNISEREQTILRGRANHEIEVGMDAVFVPAKPVKVGETWTVDPKLLLRGFGVTSKLDPDRTEGTGKLVKAFEKDGKQFGVIEVNLTIAYAARDNLQFDPPALQDIKGTLETVIDGSSNVGVQTIAARFKGRAKYENKDGVKLTLDILQEDTSRKECSLPK